MVVGRTKGFAKILSRVEVRVGNRRMLKKESGPYRGGAENPISDAELDEKFRACAEQVLPHEKVLRSLDLLRKIDTFKNIKPLVSAFILQ